jgi:hypothetical protein
MLKRIPADMSATQIKEGFVYIIEPLIPDPQPPKAIQPSPSLLNHPAIAAQPLAAISPTLCYTWLYPSMAEFLANGLRVIHLVGVQLHSAPSRLASPVPYRFDSI